jgi:hypothetical protein
LALRTRRDHHLCRNRHQARQRLQVKADRLHADTTSFSVSGAYEDSDEHMIAITHSYWRDHREDLKEWKMALVTTHQGDIPLFLQPLSGNTSDKESLVKVVANLHVNNFIFFRLKLQNVEYIAHKAKRVMESTWAKRRFLPDPR